MNGALSLIADSWQILLGVAFLIAIRMVKSRKHKVLVHYERPKAIGETQSQYPNKNQDPIKDALLMEGVNPATQSELAEECIRRGILCSSNMHALPAILRKYRYAKIRVPRGNIVPVSRIMHTACFASGILLAFSIDGNIEVI